MKASAAFTSPAFSGRPQVSHGRVAACPATRRSGVASWMGDVITSVMSNGKKSVSVQEALELIQEKHLPIVDVRTPEEFAEGHPVEAVNITWNESFVHAMRETYPNLNGEILLSCKSGARSAASQEALNECGYTNTINVKGGYLAWAGASLPTEK
mmetsp:Transcript_53777/g.131792  ORF Transcript_53777/g.131792 Transcript_53777/m.131792 type:complete len:155 (-) Transcript_53777:253-717(-)